MTDVFATPDDTGDIYASELHTSMAERLSPGYLARSERRQRDQAGTEFWLSPSKTDQYITGRRASPF